jgi:hypothetical protein
MRILFYSGGVAGSGHVVLGLSIANALKRSGRPYEYAILSVETPFADLARRSGVPIMTVPAEGADVLGGDRYPDSALYKAIDAFKPDVLLVDLSWFTLDAFIHDLPCRKLLLVRQVDPGFFHFRLPDREFELRPGDYDLILRTEPGFELPFPSASVEPIVLRNRGEILERGAARADLSIGMEADACLFAFNGAEGEGATAWKCYSYLQDEGWTVYRSDNRQGGLFPAVDYFEAFDMLVCGAGYSAFWEARAFEKEAYFVPFPRHFEDQRRRIELNSEYSPRANGADELVSRLLISGF